MHVSVVRFLVLLVIALAVPGASTRASAQAPADGLRGGIRGTAIDASSGVLPGVTVVATAVDGRTLASAVTDGTGDFTFDRLPSGPVDLVFELDGFSASRTRVVVQPQGSTVERVVQRMELVTRSESVIVRGDPPVPPPPPRPVLEPVPVHEQASVCGPAKVESVVPSLGTLRSRRDDETKVLFGAGDELLIDGGTRSGLSVGQNFVVRRQYPTALRHGRNKSLIVMGEHTSGLLQIVAVEDQVATAVIVYACDEMMRGDYLGPFEPEPALTPDPVAPPAFDDAARILFADAGQPLGVTGRMMVIDRGSRHDVRPGQRFTLFRRSRFGDARPIVVGESVVVSVRTDSSTIRVERATDAIFFGDRGDWAAPQRP